MGLSGISSSFPELFRTKGYVPTCYAPVCHSRIATSVRLACVRPAASVRSEPGSNSPVEFLNRKIRFQVLASTTLCFCYSHPVCYLVFKDQYIRAACRSVQKGDYTQNCLPCQPIIFKRIVFFRLASNTRLRRQQSPPYTIAFLYLSTLLTPFFVNYALVL